jgi:hypothetical protein
MMLARTLTAAMLVLATATAAWSATVTGTLESVSEGAAILRVDDGGAFSVDTTKLPADERAKLRTGDRVVLTGNFPAAALLFQAASVSSAPAVLRGSVTAVQGNTVTLRSTDGASYTVDLGGAQSTLGRAPQPGDRLIVSGSYAGSVNFNAYGLLATIPPLDATRSVEGTIEGLLGDRLAVRSAAGEVWNVDISGVSAQQRQGLGIGDQVAIAGTRAAGPFELSARTLERRASGGGFLRDIFRQR